MSELKPCPFCGGNAEFVNTIAQDYCRDGRNIVCTVRCVQCNVQTGGFESKDHTFAYKDAAARAWNRRCGQAVDHETASVAPTDRPEAKRPIRADAAFEFDYEAEDD